MSKEIVLSFIEKINNADIDGLAALMSDDHIFIDNIGNEHYGKETMKAGWKAYYSRFPNYKIEVRELFQDHNTFLLSGIASGTFQNRIEKDASYKIPAAWKVVTENKKIKHWQVFADSKVQFEIAERYANNQDRSSSENKVNLNLPKPKLGDVTAITIASTDLEKSLEYYKSLGFNEVLRNDFPFPWIQISDGALLIMLRKDKNPFISLTYYVKDSILNKVVKDLESKGILFINKPKAGDLVKRYLMQSPDGLNISLVTNVDNLFKQPKGETMLHFPQEDYFKPEKYGNKICGLYGELAHPVADLDSSVLFWEKLGFNAVSKFTNPYPWAILSDGLAVVGLHQTKNFSYPAITFFAADMKEKIEQLKSKGLKNYSESSLSNIVLNTPEKQHINLFKLGM